MFRRRPFLLEYRFGKTIGVGAFSKVKLAVHRTSGEKVREARKRAAHTHAHPRWPSRSSRRPTSQSWRSASPRSRRGRRSDGRRL